MAMLNNQMVVHVDNLSMLYISSNRYEGICEKGPIHEPNVFLAASIAGGSSHLVH